MNDALPGWFTGIEELLPVGIGIALLLAIAFFAGRWMTRLQTRLLDSSGRVWRLARWLPLIQIAIWVAAIALSFTLLLDAPAIVLVLVLLPTIGALVVASSDFVRNGVAGAVLAFDRSIITGDLIEVATPRGDVTGRVVAIGVRRTTLRRPDGDEILLPNRTLLDSTVRTNRGHEQDSAVEIELAVDDEFTTAEFPRIRAIAENAASVSRYASSKRRPEAFLEPRGHGHYTLTVQAYAFAPEYTRHLRTDVVSLFNETTDRPHSVEKTE